MYKVGTPLASCALSRKRAWCDQVKSALAKGHSDRFKSTYTDRLLYFNASCVGYTVFRVWFLKELV